MISLLVVLAVAAGVVVLFLVITVKRPAVGRRAPRTKP